MEPYFINADPDVKLTAGESSVQRKLKDLYATLPEKPGRVCYVYIQPHISSYQPDFLILDNFLGASILEVKDWSENYINDINPVRVITQDGRQLKNPSLQTASYFGAVTNILSNSPSLLDENGKPKINIFANLVLPNINPTFLQKIMGVLERSNVNIIARDSFQGLSLEDLFSGNTTLIPDVEMEMWGQVCTLNILSSLSMVFLIDLSFLLRPTRRRIPMFTAP